MYTKLAGTEYSLVPVVIVRVAGARGRYNSECTDRIAALTACCALVSEYAFVSSAISARIIARRAVQVMMALPSYGKY